MEKYYLFWDERQIGAKVVLMTYQKELGLLLTN